MYRFSQNFNLNSNIIKKKFFRRGRILGVWGLFWCPLIHTYPMFCSESREQSTYCKHCKITTIKYKGVIQSFFTKTPPPPQQKIQTGGRAPGAPVLEIIIFPILCVSKFSCNSAIDKWHVSSYTYLDKRSQTWLEDLLKSLNSELRKKTRGNIKNFKLTPTLEHWFNTNVKSVLMYASETWRTSDD